MKVGSEIPTMLPKIVSNASDSTVRKWQGKRFNVEQHTGLRVPSMAFGRSLGVGNDVVDHVSAGVVVNHRVGRALRLIGQSGRLLVAVVGDVDLTDSISQ